ncbi:NmrA family NAD(P)-binding protein [Sphingobacterium arenae]|uniref:NAD(P)H-binding protein n=1 Tax=Sphingobacterium arenae TaxID=1280598 RepID=A0ABR7Y6R8_9SPHI|nr:NAD(P)H-binding protein [Sphingobacterium arenae]MBD1427009.1 NAD(P)H-binding protein [Sphingobacterium arenae]
MNQENDRKKAIITGATGVLNGATMANLLKIIPAEQLAVSARNIEKAKHYADRGISVRYGSYDDPNALRRSFENGDQILLVSSNDIGGDVLAQHKRAIQAAVEAGAKRILYTSAQGCAADTHYPPMKIHQATEEYLANSGVKWTSLRHGFYGDMNALLGSWRETGIIEMPEDGPIPWVDRADAGEAIAKIMVSEIDYEGFVNLAPAKAVTLEDFARYASDLTGKRVKRIVLDDETWVKKQIAKGLPEHVARFTLTLFQASRTGKLDNGSGLLAEILGREPKSAAELLDDSIA